MDINSFSSKYNLKLNINDSSIKKEDIINSLYKNLEIVDGENKTDSNKEYDPFIEDADIEIPDNLPENLNLIIPSESVRKEDVLESLSNHLSDIKTLENIQREDYIPKKNLKSSYEGSNTKQSDVSINISDDDSCKVEKLNDGGISIRLEFNDDDETEVYRQIKVDFNRNEDENIRDDFDYDSENEENDIIEDETPQVQNMIKINQASEEELKTLPGIRLVQAKKILQLRRYNTYINSFQDLQEKIGISEEDINILRRYVTIDKVKPNQNKTRGRILDI